jgi:hypothetical protein
MTDEKLTEHDHNSILSERLLMPEQYQYNSGNKETSHSLFPSSMQKQTRTSSLPSQIINIRNPLTAFNYMSIFRPISFDTSQSLVNNLINSIPSNEHIDSNSSSYSTAQSTNFSEELTLLKINIPIEMIIRTIPQQSSSSPQEQCDHRCNRSAHSWLTQQMPYQTSLDWTSKPATSLIKKAQEVFSSTNVNNDRGDVTSKSMRHVSVTDPRITNEMNKSVFIQQQQHAKTSPKPVQVSQHQPVISRCSDSSSFSCPKRCQCESKLYSSM